MLEAQDNPNPPAECLQSETRWATRNVVSVQEHETREFGFGAPPILSEQLFECRPGISGMQVVHVWRWQMTQTPSAWHIRDLQNI